MNRLVLLGGGHAHVGVLTELAARPLEGWEVQLVTPYRRQIYSGMLPGWIAGHYAIESCAISLGALAAGAAVSMHYTSAIGLDLDPNAIRCEDGSLLQFDLLSIDSGPVAAIEELPGAAEHALPIRPIEGFVAAWPGMLDRMTTGRRHFGLAILGARAAGVELAFAIEHRATKENAGSRVSIALVGTGALPLEGAPQALRRRAATILARRGVAWYGKRRAVGIDPGRIRFGHGETVGFDACLVATGAAAPAWPRRSGLATDEGGFIRVGPTLQSVSHPHVFAAGDVAAYHDPRAKSGVFAVRAGPVLAENLRALCEGRAARPWTPQRRALYLISTGDRQALASWGRWSWSGRWVWRWKDRIDRRFMRNVGAAAD